MNSIKESDIRPKQMVRKMNKLRNEDLKLFKINQLLNVVCPASKSKKFKPKNIKLRSLHLRHLNLRNLNIRHINLIQLGVLLVGNLLFLWGKRMP